jgi:hypothetical protein
MAAAISLDLLEINSDSQDLWDDIIDLVTGRFEGQCNCEIAPIRLNKAI